ncbi:2-desacetyl-2-hydroxyethyl bacteriochlorophyllide A dehydrogenase [Novosphingobium kunmingense]|uniref:2-desacetyl-2-hydroxyethyl bacteriochlorophyllide A dehydrogenase n=1 Tax=Novosphingobium kunmingense TaxID=1211806 RepID=A0A2N0I1Y6_9SPHN|nr:alcohol dehydrogenase family protein [Novosphingobium kunmingense]PKB25206.1 2-desacetyl-2-hydroxyethyl bacteriochlorophyllide A dehydrogenase [Novosphingobium kunmingense]
MKALRYYGERDVRYETMDDPDPQSVRDAVVKVDACSICGSDLHIYHGHGFSEDVGFCVGHEAVGEVMEVGSGVHRLKVGQKVMLPAAVGCGQCRSCLAGVVNTCEFSAGSCYGLSAKLQGSQADAVRVPAADMNAVPIPDGVSTEQALMMTDALATAWFGARNADIKPGSSVAIVGLGPIGLMAVDSAFVMGAHVVYAIDPIAERRKLAEESGAIALHPDEAMERIKDDTKGMKLDCAVEVVGSDATVDFALRLVRKRGTVSVIGVQQSRRFPFPLERAFAGGLTFRAGTCSVPEELPALFPLVQSGRLRPERYISHRMPLSDGAEAYRLFEAREAGALKMVLTPD